MGIKHVIYVYGTLRPGLNSGIKLAPGLIYDLGGFPGAVLPNATMESAAFGRHIAGRIVCERVEVDDEGLQRLDWLEGYDKDRPTNENFYLRVPIFGDGWIYVLNRPVSSKYAIEGGDWLKYKGQSKGHNCHLLEQQL